MSKFAPYSKAIAALVSAVLAAVVVRFGLDVDISVLEGAILAILASLGVYSAPANE